MHIGVLNMSTVVRQPELQPYIDAQLHQLHYHLCPAWRVTAPSMALYARIGDVPPRAQLLVIYDDSDQQGALAYHSETDKGLVFSRDFAKTLRDNGMSWQSGASHEICEMTIDGACNRSAMDAVGNQWDLEVCDPVESTTYRIDGVEMSDFVLPSWFDPNVKASRTRWVKSEVQPTPFHVTPGGYAVRNGAPTYGERYPAWRMELKGDGSRTARRQ